MHLNIAIPLNLYSLHLYTPIHLSSIPLHSIPLPLPTISLYLYTSTPLTMNLREKALCISRLVNSQVGRLKPRADTGLFAIVGLSGVIRISWMEGVIRYKLGVGACMGVIRCCITGRVYIINTHNKHP